MLLHLHFLLFILFSTLSFCSSLSFAPFVASPFFDFFLFPSSSYYLSFHLQHLILLTELTLSTLFFTSLFYSLSYSTFTVYLLFQLGFLFSLFFQHLSHYHLRPPSNTLSPVIPFILLLLFLLFQFLYPLLPHPFPLPPIFPLCSSFLHFL